MDTLKDCDVGLSFNNLNLGSLVYCDEIILHSPSLSGLRKMIKICSNYGMAWNRVFSRLVENYTMIRT